MGGVAPIIPVINEAETIAAVVRDVPRSIVDVVIVVDGGSTDMTAARARQAGAHRCTSRKKSGRRCGARLWALTVSASLISG